METSAKSEPLRLAIRTFDRVLHRQVLGSLSITGMNTVMGELERFHQQARHQQDLSEQSDYLIAVGCRLSSDLNEQLVDRLVDTVQAHDEAIQLLSRQLNQRLRERDHAARLLRKAQDLKQETLQTGENAGLGLVL